MSTEPLFPPETSTKRFYERATYVGIVIALLIWLPLWATGPLQLSGLPELWHLGLGSIGIGIIVAILRALGPRLDPEQMSFPQLVEVLPMAHDVLKLSFAKMWMAFLLPVLTFHLLVYSPGFADDWLVQFDRMLGLEHHSWSMWVVEVGLRGPLLFAYDSLWAQSMAILIWMLVVARATDRLWGMSALSVWAGLAAMPVFFFLPALGPASQGVEYPPELIHPAYEMLKGISDGSIVRVHRLDGIISMPSFHTFFALTMLWGSWGHRWLLVAVVPLNVVLVLAVYPVGFHYIIDVVGGVLWFAASAVLMELARRRFVG